MKRRNFIKAAGALSVIPATGMASSLKNLTTSPPAAKEVYEWRTYTLNGDAELLDSFFKDTLLPAYNRKNVKTGAFKPYKLKDDEKDQRHILFVYPDVRTYLNVKKTIWNDREFLTKAKPFYDTTAPNPVYTNFESHLSEAFDRIPVHRKPDSLRTLFELRLYHSPNEEANQRKIAMFNKEEIALFDKVAINSVFYGEILSGPRMPALMYLTWYKDEETRSEAWKQFVNHPEWKRMSSLPEYKHTATNNKSILLSPLPYSQL